MVRQITLSFQGIDRICELEDFWGIKRLYIERCCCKSASLLKKIYVVPETLQNMLLYIELVEWVLIWKYK